MTAEQPQKPAGVRPTWSIIGLMLGGQAPLATGLIGLWQYATQGYFITRTGTVVDGPEGLWMSGVFILAGLAMILFALKQYRQGRTNLG